MLDARAVGNRLVLVQQTADGTVRVGARDTGSGRSLWDKQFPGPPNADSVQGRLRTDGDHIYLGGDTLRALRLSDGKEAWSRRPDGSGSGFGPPSVTDGTVYAVEKGRGLVAVDAGSGKRKWREAEGKGGESGKGGGAGEAGAPGKESGGKEALVDPPVVVRGHAYVRGASGLRAVALSSRTVVRTYTTTGTHFAAAEESEVILATGARFLTAYDLA